MPKPKKREKQQEFMERCIPMVIEDGTAKFSRQAAAICYSIWKKEKRKK